MQDSAVAALTRLLLPDTDVLTPNLPEAEALTCVHIENRKDAERAAKSCLITVSKMSLSKADI